MGSLSQELKETTSENMHRSESIDLGKMPRSQETEMSVVSVEREMEVMGITARERVLGDPDMLDIIFRYLDPPSVKRVRLVSTLWRSVCESPKFWTRRRLTVRKSNVSQVMQSRIIKLVPHIDFYLHQGEEALRIVEQLFRAIAAGELSQLKILWRIYELKNFYTYEDWVSKIPGDTIMKAAVKLEETDIYDPLRSAKDILFKFKFFAESPIMNLKRLNTYKDAKSLQMFWLPLWLGLRMLE